MGNYANTIHSLKRFIGKKFDDPQVQADISWCPFKVLKAPDGGVAFEVPPFSLPRPRTRTRTHTHTHTTSTAHRLLRMHSNG